MDYNLIIDIENRRLVAGFDSSEVGAPPSPVFGDQPTVNVQLVEPNHNNADNPWRAVTLTGQSIRVGVGSLADATPSAYIELTDDLASASATITEIRAGVLNTTSEIQRVQIQDALAGNYTLTIAGETTNGIALDASLDTIKCELEGLASITADSVSITGSATDYNVEFASSLADVGAITVNLDNITSRVGKTGTLDLHVEEILTLLDGATSVEGTMEVVRWTTADVAGETVLQVPVTITQDVIPDTVPSTTPLPGYATIDLDHINQSGAVTGQIPQWNGSEWVAATVAGTGDMLSTANLSDLADIPTARTNLGLGTAATTDSTDYATASQGATADSALQSTDIDTLAELNAVVTDATLIDTTDSRLSDARTPTAHTHTASDIDAEASTDGYVLTSDGAGNAAWEVSTGGSGHDPVTVTDSAEIDFTLTGQDITASLVASSIDETKLDASTNASLDLADSASQPGHTHTASDVTDFDTEVSNNTDVAANTADRHDAVSIAASGGRDYVTISGTQQLTLHQVDLTADVSGDLPVADGGTGASDAATARTNLGVDAAGTDNSTDVTLAGEDFLSLAGQQITANAIDLDNLSATGTPSGTTFLRGDNTWATPAGGGGGGLTLVDKTADANITAVTGEMHVVEMNSGTPFTASRNWTLPVAASVATGDQFGLMIKDGDTAFEVNVRTGATGDLLNGVDVSAASNEWELFQAGEVLIITCVDGATGDYIVERDGRIACKARIHRDATSGALSIPNSAFTLFEFPEETYNNGLITDITTNYDIEVRRSGVYNLNSQIIIDGVIPVTTTAVLAIFKNGRSTRIGTAYNVAGDGSGVYHTVYSYDNIELVAGDALSMEVLQTSGGAKNTLSIDAAPNFFSLTETL